MCQICNTMLCQIDETIAEQNYSQKSRVFRRNIFTNFLKKNKVLKFHYYHCQHSFVMNFGQVVLLLDQEFYALFLISSLDERYILKVPHCPWPGLVLDLGHPADRLPPNDTEKPKRAPWPIDAGNRIHGRSDANIPAISGFPEIGNSCKAFRNTAGFPREQQKQRKLLYSLHIK